MENLQGVSIKWLAVTYFEIRCNGLTVVTAPTSRPSCRMSEPDMPCTMPPVISKPWDFEAMCLVDDNRMVQNDVQRCADAVYYLFEGTKITNEYLEGMSYDRLCELCEQVRDWYVEDVLRLLKIQKMRIKSRRKTIKGFVVYIPLSLTNGAFWAMRLQDSYRSIYLRYWMNPGVRRLVI